MEKQEYKSKWDELVREIGVDVPEEVQQREEAVASGASAPAPAPPEDESATSRSALPKKAAVNWNSLAEELGLPPLPPEEAPPAPPVTERQASARSERPREVREERPREESRRQEGRQDQPRREREEPPRREESESRGRERGGRGRGRRGDRQERAERPERAERSERSGRGERAQRPERGERTDKPEGGERSGERRGRRGRRGRPQRESEPLFEEQNDDLSTERGAVGSFDEVTTARRQEEDRVEEIEERPELVREEPPKSAAVSLWHKIFGSPAEQTAKLADEPHDELLSVPAGDLRDEPRDAGGFADARVEEEVVEEAFGGTDEATDAEDESSTDRKRGRSRRRRGRGRRSQTGQGEERSGRARESRRGDDLDAADDEFGEPDADELQVDEPVGVTAETDDDDSDDALAGAGAPRARGSLRGTIPSWDEAIGYIVDTNMQSRSQRRPPPRQGGRGEGGRGRSRGRRRSQ